MTWRSIGLGERPLLPAAVQWKAAEQLLQESR